MGVYGSIDVGTNTVRLLAAEVEDGRIVRPVLDLRANTRLGEGLPASGEIGRVPAERTIEAVAGFARRLREHDPASVGVVGTEAIRRARNSEWFIEAFREGTGLDIEIISGDEEARRMLMGVRAGVGGILPGGPKLVIDIGGGSTELVATDDFAGHEAVSIPVGAVTLYEAFVRSDPPAGAELGRVREYAKGVLGAHAGLIGSGRLLVGTAGTITTLAAVDLGMAEYDPGRVTGHVISREALDGMIERFLGVDAAARREMPGLEPGREDIIITGAVLLGVLMDISGSGRITVSDYGLREGNLLFLQTIA